MIRQMDYFKVKALAEGIFHIYEPGGVFTTLLLGKKSALLIDTGYGFGDLADFVRTMTDLPLTVVLTHGHTDHCGGNYQFPEVFMNLADTPTYLWYETTQKAMIVDKFQRDREAAKLPPVWPDDFNREVYLQQHTRHFEALKDGQIFDLGDRKIEVIFMPGHTEGSIVLLDHQTGLLFSGDNISDSLWIFFDTSATLTQYASKLMNLMRLPIRGIVSSHRDIIFPVGIIEDLLRTIGCIAPETDRSFTHPRTGQKALKHREACTVLKDVPYIYVVYNQNKIG